MKKIGLFLTRAALAFMVLVILNKPLLSANVSPSAFGINAHLAADAVLAKANIAGIKWIRIDVLWNNIEVANNSFDYSSVDHVVNYANQNGLSVLAVLAYTPTWANKTKKYNLPPDNVNYWKRFVQKTVDRYKDRIKYWNIWNEPNMPVFFDAGKDVFVSKIFIPAALVIKGVDPAAFIVGPELAHKTAQNQEWYFWMKYILDNAGQYIDVISHHMYVNEGALYLFELLETGDYLIPSVKKVVTDAGHGDKPFWITETGWQTNQFSEEVQADRYLDFLQRMRQKGFPHKVFFYELIDDPTLGTEPYGILRSSKSEKPAYRVYADFIAGLYPPIDDDSSTESKKCYAEESASERGDKPQQRHFLLGLRELRKDLRQQLSGGRQLVEAYYQHGDEFTRLARHDARLNRLGKSLLVNLERVWNTADDEALSAMQKPLLHSAEQILAVLANKEISPQFKRGLYWCQKQLDLIKQQGMARYKWLYLPSQVERLND